MSKNLGFSTLEKSAFIICPILIVALIIVLSIWTYEKVYLSTVAGKVYLLTEMETFAKQSDNPKEIALSLNTAAGWAKRHSDSTADIILTLVASNTVQNLCAVLRQKTGKDFGNDAREWVNHFSASQ